MANFINLPPIIPGFALSPKLPAGKTARDYAGIPAATTTAFSNLVAETRALNAQRQPQFQDALRRGQITAAELDANLRSIIGEQDAHRAAALVDGMRNRYLPALTRALPAAGLQAPAATPLVVPLNDALRKAAANIGSAAINKLAEIQAAQRLFAPPYSDAVGGQWNSQVGYWASGAGGDGVLGWSRLLCNKDNGALSLDMRSYLAPGNYAQVTQDPTAAFVIQAVTVPMGTRRLRFTASFDPLTVDICAAGVLGYANAEGALHIGGVIPGYFPQGSSHNDVGSRFSQELSLGHIRSVGLGIGADRLVETRMRSLSCEVLLEAALPGNVTGYVSAGIYGWCVSLGGAYAHTIMSTTLRQIEVQYWSS